MPARQQAIHTKPPHAPAPEPRPLPPPKGAGGHAVNSVKQAAQQPPAHPAQWQPWAPLAAQAEARFKAEIGQALSELSRRTGDAGRILDTAQAMAAESGGQLRAAAWSAFSRNMDAAAVTESAILAPAVAAYDTQVTAAVADYTAAITDAENTYKALMAGVAQAKNDGAAMTAAS
jgi:hypothetical protein